MQEEIEKIETLIIGSGPAGYTAAIYAARADMKPVVIQGLQPGGQLTTTTDVDNYPGYKDGVTGPEMMEDFKKQAERFGTETRWGMVTKVDFSERPFKVEIDESKNILAETVIICTGASARWLGIEDEERLNGYGVSACATCDGFFYKNKKVCVIGGGNTAVEETLDACHAIQYQSINKYKRPNKLNAKDEIEKQRARSKYLQSQVNDLWRTVPTAKKEDENQLEKGWPSEPEENLLYFLEKYSPILTPWQREICRIVRRIAQYFYPQYQTKVMNEGFASFTHHYIFNKLYDQDKVDDGAMIEFFKLHSAVLYQPPFDSPNYNGFNPYALGFAILKDIQRVCTTPDEEDKRWFPHLADTDWRITIKDIAANYRDESAILQFLGPKVIRDQGLFNLHDESYYDNYIVTSIHNERGYKKVRKHLSASYETAAMIPDIQITNADITGSRDLTLLHESYKGKRLDKKTADRVLSHVQKLWGHKVKLYTMHDENLLDVFECKQVSNRGVGSQQLAISDTW